MTSLRPAVSDNDSFLSKIIKYIPAEIIAVYTAIIGVLKQNLDSKLPDQGNVHTYFVVLLIIVVITPVWTYFAVIDAPVTPPAAKQKRAIFHAVIAVVSFIIWVYAIGDILFKCWLCQCYAPQSTDCFDQSGRYNSVLGSVVLIVYTGLLVPLLERIILGPAASMALKKAVDGALSLDDVKTKVDNNNNSPFSRELIVAICWAESSFDPAATATGSTSKGLMMMNDGAVGTVNANTPSGTHFDPADMLDPDKAIACGSWYLQILYSKSDWGCQGNKRETIRVFRGMPGYTYADKILAAEGCLQSTVITNPQTCLNQIHT